MDPSSMDGFQAKRLVYNVFDSDLSRPHFIAGSRLSLRLRAASVSPSVLDFHRDDHHAVTGLHQSGKVP